MPLAGSLAPHDRQMSAIAIVYALFGDRAAAEAAAAQMVEQRLAACANIMAPCISLYRWNGEMTRAEELPVVFKTSMERRDELTAALAAVHAYEVPAVSGWSASTTIPYAAWVDEQTRVNGA